MALYKSNKKYEPVVFKDPPKNVVIDTNEGNKTSNALISTNNKNTHDYETYNNGDSTKINTSDFKFDFNSFEFAFNCLFNIKKMVICINIWFMFMGINNIDKFIMF